MYRTVAQLDSLTGALGSWFPSIFKRVKLPEKSVDGASVYALRMRAGSATQRRRSLVIGGTHARELMNPDAIVELAIDLLVSYLNGTNVVYGGRTWLAQDVRLILETMEIWFVPCINPDGRTYVLTVDDLWRKNRRDNPGTTCDGVDLNRNLDLLWGVAQGSTSCSPCSDVYCGPSAFSEPETRNVKYLLDTYPMVTFVDVHSFSELVLYPWGHAPNQTTDSTKRFTTLPSGTCNASIPGSYSEYIDPRDLKRFQTVSGRVVDSVKAVRGRVYTPQQGRDLYATTGTHSDYVYSRHIANPSLAKTYGFTLETGPDTGNVRESFHPADPTLIKRDAKAAILALLEQSVCAIEFIGLSLLGRQTEVKSIRQVRDEMLASTEAGRDWIALFEHVQMPALNVVLRKKQLAKSTAEAVAMVGRLLKRSDSLFGRAEAAQVSALLDQVAAKVKDPTVADDLRLVQTAVGKFADQPVAKVVSQLTRQAPRPKRAARR